MGTNGSGSRSVGIGWDDIILPGIEDPQNLGTNEWDQKLVKIQCVFSLYDKMRWKWDDVYLLWGLPNICSPSLYPLPLPQYRCTPTVAPWRCTWRPGLSELGDPLGDRDWVNSEMHLEAVIQWVWRPTSAKCILVTGSLQECLRGGEV